MNNPNILNTRAVTVSIGDEFASVDFTFDAGKKAKVIVPIDTAGNPRTYLVNSQDLMANNALCRMAHRLVIELVDEFDGEEPGDGGR